MVYKTDPGTYKSEFDRNDYVLLKDIIADEFLAHLEKFRQECASGTREEYAKWRIPGKKQQYVFEFPSQEAVEQFRSGIARLTGLDEKKITISERHLKQYDQHAVEFPAPHKDRHASGISVGIPVHLGEGTSVCVFPSLDRSDNPNDKAIFIEAEDVKELYRTKAVRLNESVGDIIVFQGSSMFHERSRPRGTAVLYIKLNDRGEDPIGENIYSEKAECEVA